jgi:hypothetical protein
MRKAMVPKTEQYDRLQPHPAAHLVINDPRHDSQDTGKLFFVVIPNQPSRDIIALLLNPPVMCHIDFFSGTVPATLILGGFIMGIDCDVEAPGTVGNKGFARLCRVKVFR